MPFLAFSPPGIRLRAFPLAIAKAVLRLRENRDRGQRSPGPRALVRSHIQNTSSNPARAVARRFALPLAPMSLPPRLNGTQGGWQRSVRARVGGSASKPARGRAHARNTLHARARAGGRRAQDVLERGVELERLANLLGTLGTDVVDAKAERNARGWQRWAGGRAGGAHKSHASEDVLRRAGAGEGGDRAQHLLGVERHAAAETGCNPLESRRQPVPCRACGNGARRGRRGAASLGRWGGERGAARRGARPSRAVQRITRCAVVRSSSASEEPRDSPSSELSVPEP